MDINKVYTKILTEELVPAMGCTEPIAVAYASAKAREILGNIPSKVKVAVSGNLVKNIKSVVIPNTNGLKGIKASCCAGIIGGNSEKMLEVISSIAEEDKIKIKDYMNSCDIKVCETDSEELFEIEVVVYYESSYAKVKIIKHHTNIVLIEKDNEIIFEQKDNECEQFCMDRNLLNVDDIIKYADTCNLDGVKNLIELQIKYNETIADIGLKENYGANIGKNIMKNDGDCLKSRLKAYSAAASDARMGGCELPVVIVSGSGNQGITTSVPVIKYAKEIKASEELLIRGLLLSNLLTIYQKTGIGKLSAYCGVVSAAASSSAAIEYMSKGSHDDIKNVLTNSLAITSGIVCDGAKESCAAKIAAAVDSGILGYYMNKTDDNFDKEDGIIGSEIEETIKNVCRVAKVGMKGTDKEIIKIMIGE